MPVWFPINLPLNSEFDGNICSLEDWVQQNFLSAHFLNFASFFSTGKIINSFAMIYLCY